MADTILQTAEDLQIVPLTKQLALYQAESILALENNWKEIGDEPWNLENLMYELPEKWELSHIALNHGGVIGYQIGCLRDVRDKGLPDYLQHTVKDSYLLPYLKKIVVDRDARVLGVGKRLIKSFLEKLLEKGHNRLIFRVRTDNPAVKFYEKLRFTQREEIDRTRPDGVASYFYDSSVSDVLKNL